MRRLCLVIAVGIAIVAFLGLAQQAPSTGPYSVLKTAKVGGDGGFDYVYADSDGRKLYIPRKGPEPRVTVFDLDTLKPAVEISKTSANGAAVDPKSGHGFASSKPVAMWDTRTLAPIRTSFDVLPMKLSRPVTALTPVAVPSARFTVTALM